LPLRGKPLFNTSKGIEMHIIKSISFACLAFCATQAHALDPATMNAPSTLKVFVSGASTLSPVLGGTGGLFAQNCLGGTRTTYTAVAAIGGSTFGTIHSCSLIPANDFGLPANTNIMFQKRDAGGSAFGVYPVSNNTPIDFINPASCTGPASGAGTCTVLSLRTADGGLSELEPAIFAAVENTPAQFVGPGLGNKFTSRPLNLQIISGLAVTQSLYAALQVQQGLVPTQRPNISQAAAGQMLRNNFLTNPVSWKLLLPSASALAQNSPVIICRESNGAGQQTAANRFFLEYPFNSGATMTPLTLGDSTPPPNELTVIENPTTADSTACMTAANTAGNFALGHISLENAQTAAWKFVKVGGQEPSRDEAKAGRYAYFFESTCQISTLAPANVQSFLNLFCRGFASPRNLGLLPAATQAGVMVPPQTTVCPSTFGATTYGPADAPLTGPVPPVLNTFCSRVTRDGNSAQFPSFFR
jgi:hypothetical protein